MAEYNLIAVTSAPHLAAFDLEMDFETSRAADPSLAPGQPLPSSRLFEIDFAHDELTVHPLSTIPSSRFLKSKYPRIKSISVELPGAYSVPATNDEAHEFLRERLPLGFVSNPVFGLGLMKEMRPLISAIEKLPVSHLEISDLDTQVRASTFVLNRFEYEEIRLAFQRIARQYQKESLADRNVLAHNEVLHNLLPVQFPLEERPYKPGTVFKLLGGNGAKSIVLRGRDRKAAVTVVSQNAEAIADHDPQALLQLQRDIELVSLDKLIKAFGDRLNQNLNESVWQKLFELNPFILSMVFGYPIVLVAAGVSAGGITLRGDGNKIADFLVANAGTHNAALVEIKKPQTPLFSSEYRTGVWNPSKEVTGAIVQVLDQRQKFLTNLATLKHNSGASDLQAFAVDCVVVLGRTPATPDKCSSLELIRSQLKDVRLVTFDELFDKLVLLREMLSGTDYESSDVSDDEGLLAADEPLEDDPTGVPEEEDDDAADE